MAELQLIIVFHGRHFVRHLKICNRNCVKLLQLICALITHNSMKRRSLYINKWLIYIQLSCFTATILSAILEFVIRFVSNSDRLCPVLFRTIQKMTSLNQTVCMRSTNAAHTHVSTTAHTHDDSIRRNTMHCI